MQKQPKSHTKLKLSCKNVTIVITTNFAWLKRWYVHRLGQETDNICELLSNKELHEVEDCGDSTLDDHDEE